MADLPGQGVNYVALSPHQVQYSYPELFVLSLALCQEPLVQEDRV